MMNCGVFHVLPPVPSTFNDGLWCPSHALRFTSLLLIVSYYCYMARVCMIKMALCVLHVLFDWFRVIKFTLGFHSTDHFI